MKAIKNMNWAKKCIETGAELAKAHETWADAIEYIVYGDVSEDIMDMVQGRWEYGALLHAGFAGYIFDIIDCVRYGDIPVDYDGYPVQSMNYADNELERGVSIASPDWEKTISAMFIKSDRPIINFKGIVVGYGSDGEPVVVPVKQIK